MLLVILELRVAKDVVRPDSTQENALLHKLKRHSIVISDTKFPDLTNAFHLLDVKGGMAGI